MIKSIGDTLCFYVLQKLHAESFRAGLHGADKLLLDFAEFHQ